MPGIPELVCDAVAAISGNAPHGGTRRRAAFPKEELAILAVVPDVTSRPVLPEMLGQFAVANKEDAVRSGGAAGRAGASETD